MHQLCSWYKTLHKRLKHAKKMLSTNLFTTHLQILTVGNENAQRKPKIWLYSAFLEDAIVCSMQDCTILMREINPGPGEVYGCITAHIRANFILQTPRGLISLASMIATCTFIEVTPENCSGHFKWHCILHHILNSLYLIFSIFDFQPGAKRVILKLRMPVGCM